MIVRSASWLAAALLASTCLTVPPRVPSGEGTAVQGRVDARTILGNPKYPALCYGGFRGVSREREPSVAELKEDMRILSAMGIKLVRTYNTQQYRHAASLLEAIRQLREEHRGFEMYVMLGAWIECAGAWSESIDHDAENLAGNRAEIEAAVRLANAHPETVKMIAVGNEAMVHWATSYFVRPRVIRKWVDDLQRRKASGGLPPGIWITSSDNYASWGGAAAYRTKELEALLRSVDFVSLHTYPFHETHHEPETWGVPAGEERLSKLARIDAAMRRAQANAVAQYRSVASYVAGLDLRKPIHIGETGWASRDSKLYGRAGTRAADEYKARSFYRSMREWTEGERITCFYFEAFDEPWKDAGHPQASENHFGLFDVRGRAKYVLWDRVDAGVFDGLRRGGAKITKTFGGDEAALLASVLRVPLLRELPRRRITTVNAERRTGRAVTERRLVLLHRTMKPARSKDMTFPSAPLRLNVWEGTCAMTLTPDDVIHVVPGTGDWWGCALEIEAGGTGENLSEFASGRLHFEIRGHESSTFDLGIQTGRFAAGTQVNYSVRFGPRARSRVTQSWVEHAVPLTALAGGKGLEPTKLEDVTSLLYLRGGRSEKRERIEIRNVWYSRR